MEIRAGVRGMYSWRKLRNRCELSLDPTIFPWMRTCVLISKARHISGYFRCWMRSDCNAPRDTRSQPRMLDLLISVRLFEESAPHASLRREPLFMMLAIVELRNQRINKFQALVDVFKNGCVI